MSRRHRARRLALQGLCCLDAQGPKSHDLIDLFIADSGEPAATIADARNMLGRAQKHLSQCDEILSAHTKDWGLGRLAMVDRNILRLATAELLSARTPFKVVIVEAMKLAAEFSTAESPRFINGVLDSIAKELAPPDGRTDSSEDDEPQADRTRR